MKKIVLFTFLLIGISISTNAQKDLDSKVTSRVNKFVTKIEKNLETKWSAKEKEIYIEAKKTQILSAREIWKKYKDNPEEKKEKQLEANKVFRKSIIDALGKERAIEIIRAGNKKD